MASNLRAMASNLLAMASNLLAMASNLLAMASNLLAMASNLRAMASNLRAMVERPFFDLAGIGQDQSVRSISTEGVAGSVFSSCGAGHGGHDIWR